MATARPPMRTLAASGVVAISILALVVIAGIVLGWFTWPLGVVVVLCAGCLIATGIVGAAVLRLHRRADALTARTMSRLDELAANHVDALARQSELFDELAGSVRSLEDAIAGTRSDIETTGAQVSAIVADDLRQVYWQIDALLDLRGFLSPRAPLPAFRDWAASPDVLRWMIEWLWGHRPAVVVECGSGVSTIVLGYTLQRIGAGRVVALEHDASHAELTRERLSAHGLDDFAEVRHAPLTGWADSAGVLQQWYDTAVLDGVEGIGLLFVDGPPARLGPTARYPALPALWSRCRDDVVVVLDDTVREGEQVVSGRWVSEFPEMDRTMLKTDKGTHVFRRRP